MISIKSESEIELMRRAGEVLCLSFEKLKEILKPGVKTKELDLVVEKFILENKGIPSFKGFKGMSGAIDYPASICASVNNEVVHGIPGNRVLIDGDIISVDIGVFLNGFHADAARTFPVGHISEIAEKLIKVTEKSFYKGIREAVTGNRIIDISAAIQDYVEKNGFSVVREYVGHGIGTQMHEAPQIPNCKTRERGPRLSKGMTLAVEPMVNAGGYFVNVLDNKWTVVTADGSLSAHYENTIAITDKQPIILTKIG